MAPKILEGNCCKMKAKKTFRQFKRGKMVRCLLKRSALVWRFGSVLVWCEWRKSSFRSVKSNSQTLSLCNSFLKARPFYICKLYFSIVKWSNFWEWSNITNVWWAWRTQSRRKTTNRTQQTAATKAKGCGIKCITKFRHYLIKAGSFYSINNLLNLQVRLSFLKL